MLTALGFTKMVSSWIAPIMGFVFNLPGAAGFALITGLISGYPMGAKTVADIWHDGEISTKEAQRLLAFCNNAGPLFIVGVVGIGILGNASAGYMLWIGHVVAALIIGFLTRGNVRAYGDRTHNQRKHEIRGIIRSDSINIGKTLGDAVKNAMEALVVVGGLIIFFSVVVRAVTIIVVGSLPFFANTPFIGIIAGLIEVTGGVKLLGDLPSALSPARMAAIGGLIAFGGFSVHAQALHFTAGTGIKAGTYVLSKALHGAVAAGVTWVLCLQL